MINLGSKTWGSGPAITFKFEYEKQRSGASMGYRAKITISSLSGSYYFGYPIYMKMSIAGTLRETKTLKAASPSQWTSAITYTTPWYWVSNKISGTTPISFQIYSGSGSSRDSTYSFTMAIDPAASEFSSLEDGTLGTAQTIGVKQYNADFTHTIEYACGDIYGTVCTKAEDTEISWTPPLSLAAASPNSTQVSAQLTIVTYDGDTLIGSNKKTITLDIPESVKPSVSIAVTDEAGCFGKYGKYVQGKSELTVKLTSAGIYGSTINTRSLTFDERSHTVDEDGTASIETIKGTGSLKMVATVKDSRGRTATAEVTLAVLEYSPPSVTDLVIRRSNANTTSNPSGAYLAVDYSVVVSSLDNKNSAHYYLYYKKVTDTEWTVEALTSLDGAYVITGLSSVFAADTASSYDVKIVAEDDFFNGETAIFKTGRGSSIKKVWAIAPKGMGYAFGKVAEYIASIGERLEVAWHAKFYKDVEIDGKAKIGGDAEISGITTLSGDLNIATDAEFETLWQSVYETNHSRSILSTLKNIVRKILELIGIVERKTERKLLWENANWSSGFGAQTIALDLSEFDFVDVESMMTVSSPFRKTFRVPMTADSVPILTDFPYGTASKIVCWYRAAYVEKASGVRFMGAWQSNTTADTSMNTAAVPFRIYGGKEKI